MRTSNGENHLEARVNDHVRAVEMAKAALANHTAKREVSLRGVDYADNNDPTYLQLEIAVIEAELAVLDQHDALNDQDPKLVALRRYAVTELQKAAEIFAECDQQLAYPADVQAPTVDAIETFVSAYLGFEASVADVIARRKAASQRIALVFTAIRQANGLINADRLARGLPRPPRVIHKSVRRGCMPTADGSPLSPCDAAECNWYIDSINNPPRRNPKQEPTALEMHLAERRKHLADVEDKIATQALLAEASDDDRRSAGLTGENLASLVQRKYSKKGASA